LYTMFGGIKATFLTDYVHTLIIFAVILTFAFTAYATNATIGSPSKVYDLLVKAAAQHPVSGNAGGSYLTMQSREGAIFFVINVRTPQSTYPSFSFCAVWLGWWQLLVSPSINIYLTYGYSRSSSIESSKTADRCS
jgi:hypothetical protein